MMSEETKGNGPVMRVIAQVILKRIYFQGEGWC